MARAPARTHTYPVCRPTVHPGTPGPASACQHVKKWEYHHSRLCEHDIAVVAQAFGITESELLLTALRLNSKEAT